MSFLFSKKRPRKPEPSYFGISASVWIISFYLHIACALLIYFNFDKLLPKLDQSTEYAQARDFTRKAYRHAIEERIRDLEEVKSLMETLYAYEEEAAELNAPPPTELKDTPLEPKETQAYPESNEALLELTEILHQEIKALEKNIKEAKNTSPNPEQTGEEQTTQLENSGTPNGKGKNGSEDPLSDESALYAITAAQKDARQRYERYQHYQQTKTDGFSLSANDLAASQIQKDATLKTAAKGRVKDLSAPLAALYQSEQANEYMVTQPDASSAFNTPIFSNRKVRLHSRKLSQEGQSTPWIFIDSWYLIGPFPNPNRRNIDTRFAPEIAIDLDARYIGAQNHILKWQYLQYSEFPITPPDMQDYAIYYAFTEFHSEIETDAWLAIGSDDQSKFWINNILVWHSGDEHKSWNATEGYRKIRLREGRNRFLFRLENGQYSGGFSVMLSLNNT